VCATCGLAEIREEFFVSKLMADLEIKVVLLDRIVKEG
jgi:hypothetical protein